MASVPRKLSRTETNINNFDFGFTRSRGNQDRIIVGDVDVVVVDVVDVVDVVVRTRLGNVQNLATALPCFFILSATLVTQ